MNQILENYLLLSHKYNWTAKFTSLAVAVGCLIEFLRFESFYRHDIITTEIIREDLAAIIAFFGFTISLFIIFSYRFLVLFSNQRKSALKGQILWIIGSWLIVMFALVSNKILRGSFLKVPTTPTFDSLFSDKFLYTSQMFEELLIIYLFIAAIKEISIFTLSLFAKIQTDFPKSDS